MEEKYMVCTRVDELADPVDGSTTTCCVECASDIWISKESRREMGRQLAMPLCSRCAVRLSADSPPQEVGMPSKGQMDEIVQQLVKDHPEWEDTINRVDTMDAFEGLKATANMVAATMTDPKADWGSLLVFEDYEGHVFPPVPVSEMLAAGIPKELLARQLFPAMAQAANAKRALFGLSSWSLETDKPVDPSTVGSLQDHPDGKEILVLIDITANGVEQMSVAYILRDGISGPKLSEWRDIDKPESSDGLFVDALIPTLQLIRTLQEQGS